MSDPDVDLAQLRAAARAYLEWEAEISPLGIPQRSVPRAARAQPEADASTSARPAAQVPTNAQLLPQEPGRGADPNARPQVPAAHRAAAPTADPPAAAAALGSAALPPAHSAPSDVGTGVHPDKRTRLALIEQQVRGCVRCELAQGRTHTVFARGNPDSPIAFVGEGPGQDEDLQGAPFVGAAGQLLDKMVAAMGFARDDVYICNVVKCRPPGNRTPMPLEAQACSAYLQSQLDAVRPRVIVALGRCAAENMGLVAGGGWRGRWGKFRGYDVMPTYHPAFLLRSPEFKRPVWEDLQKVMQRLKDPG